MKKIIFHLIKGGNSSFKKYNRKNISDSLEIVCQDINLNKCFPNRLGYEMVWNVKK